MAKKAKKDGDDGVSAIRGNGYDPEAVTKFVGRIELLESEKQILKDKCKEDCEPISADIKEVMDEAKEAGIPKKELKAALKARELRRKIDDQREKLNEYEQNNFDNLVLALGGLKDLPLGEFAIKAAA